MSVSARRPGQDPLVLPFLDAADDEAARARLGDLLVDHASPLIHQIVRRQLLSGGGAAARTREQDAEDLHGVLMLRLTAQLWVLRREEHDSGGAVAAESAAPIASFANYVARAAFNACHEWLRQRAPRRARLQSRVRYVLTHDPRLMMREAAGRDWWCGARDAWNARDTSDRALDTSPAHADARLASEAGDADGTTDADVPVEIVRGAADEQAAVVRREAGDPAVSPRAFAAFVHATLAALGRPCRFGTLVAAIGACLGEEDVPAASGGGGQAREAAGRGQDGREDGLPSEVERLRDQRPAILDVLTHREHLERLWNEIRELPPRQRAALLLNLRDDEGRGMIELWPQTGIAPLAELARALDLTEGALRELWPTLPRDDQWIAERLGVTRRQVINLRKCARERLARRLRVILAPA
jgi:RNA polymerase sigma factor (sigma-70 family)